MARNVEHDDNALRIKTWYKFNRTSRSIFVAEYKIDFERGRATIELTPLSLSSNWQRIVDFRVNELYRSVSINL